MRNELIRKQHENTGREELIKDYEAAYDEYSGMNEDLERQIEGLQSEIETVM